MGISYNSFCFEVRVPGSTIIKEHDRKCMNLL